MAYKCIGLKGAKMKKQALSFILAVIMVMSLLPVSVFATEITDPWDALNDAMSNNGTVTCGAFKISDAGGVRTITLVQDIVCSTASIHKGPIGLTEGAFILDLNGHVLDRNYANTEGYDAWIITVAGNQALTIKDSTDTLQDGTGAGKITGGCDEYGMLCGGIKITGLFSKLVLESGSICGNTGSAVYINGEVGFGKDDDNRPVFVMVGGKISDNQAYNGGGIYNNDGHVTIEGGIITENEAIAEPYGDFSGNGGAIYNRCNCVIIGGNISSNSAVKAGGGIYNEGSSLTFGGSPRSV